MSNLSHISKTVTAYAYGHSPFLAEISLDVTFGTFLFAIL